MGEPFADVPSAVSAVKSAARAKFDETVELVVQLNVDPRRADELVRGVAVLPHGTGKTVRIAVFAKDEKAEEALVDNVRVLAQEIYRNKPATIKKYVKGAAM